MMINGTVLGCRSSPGIISEIARLPFVPRLVTSIHKLTRSLDRTFGDEYFVHRTDAK